MPIASVEKEEEDLEIAAARTKGLSALFDAAWTEGARLTLEQAAELALA